jgi:hypothetical protein
MTEAAGVPEAVSAFVVQQISSIEQLEVLLFLRRNPGRPWTPEEVSRELRGSNPSIVRRLTDLSTRGFARLIEGEAKSVFVYSPRTPQLADSVNALAAVYAERPHSVIRLIFSKPRLE